MVLRMENGRSGEITYVEADEIGYIRDGKLEYVVRGNCRAVNKDITFAEILSDDGERIEILRNISLGGGDP